jgi:ribose 5-phosphate isomerase A
LTGDTQNYKKLAAQHALKLVEPGMVLGLGTGSTAAAFVELLAERVKNEKLNLHCVATSERTKRLAEQHGIAVAEFNVADIDLTVDGADEIDPQLNLIKGGGGALLREKIVAMASERVCIIADASKYVERLGAFPLPIEIVDFGLAATLAMIGAAASDAECAGSIALRRGHHGEPFRTDSGNLIVDCAFGSIPDAQILAELLDVVPGVVEHGLFIGIADEAVLAGPSGITVLRPEAENL